MQTRPPAECPRAHIDQDTNHLQSPSTHPRQSRQELEATAARLSLPDVPPQHRRDPRFLSWKSMRKRTSLLFRRHRPPLALLPTAPIITIIVIPSRAHHYPSRQQPRLLPATTDRFFRTVRILTTSESRMIISQRHLWKIDFSITNNNNSSSHPDQGRL